MYRAAARLLRRWIGPRAATAVGWVLVVGLTYLVVTGLLLDGLVSVADKAFSLRDTTTAEGVHQPTTALRSGGPDSLVPWDSLGYQGRKFTGLGPYPDDIEKVTQHRGGGADPGLRRARVRHPTPSPGRPSPSRTSSARADSSARTCSWSPRPAVGGSTPRWWTPSSTSPTGTRRRSRIQYSYLPSWISYLVDQSKAREAGRALFDAVYDPWSKLPAGQRPRLFVAGESLGLLRRRDRLQRRVRPAQPHRRHAVRRPAQLQHPVPRVQRPP